MKKNWTVFLPKLGMIVLGNLLYALAVTLFIVPNQLLTGGTTGLALFFYRTAGIPVSVFVCVFNVAMFLLGAWILGKQFAVTTILSTLIYPLLLSVLEHSGLPGIVMEERLTAVLYAGVLIGAGIGIVMRAGASTGGMDIPALILKKKRSISVSATIYLCDCIVLALQMMNTDIATRAIADDELWNTIHHHRELFTSMSGVDYTPDIRKRIRLLPPDDVIDGWRSDYKDMQSSMIYGEKPIFEELMRKMEELEKMFHT